MDHYTTAEADRIPYTQKSAYAIGMLVNNLQAAALPAMMVILKENSAMDISDIVEGVNQFALDLYEQLRGEEGNLFFSPSGITTALAMTYAGAAGVTEMQMAKTLHLEMPNDQLHDGMHALQSLRKSADKKEGYRLHLATVTRSKSTTCWIVYCF